MSEFIEMLNEPKNNLGGTEDVTAIVKKRPSRIGELFNLYFQDDEWVRLRVSSVLKRLWRYDSSMIEPFLEDWVMQVSKIDQPSIQWTFAQMVEECDELLSEDQRKSAIKQVKGYLDKSDDWIVLNCSIKALSDRAVNDNKLKAWLIPRLEKLQQDSRKSVSGRAKKALARLA